MHLFLKSPFKYLRTISILYWKKLLLLLPFQNDSYTKFVILCTARTGSTWLHTLLNSHPRIISLGEVVDHRTPKSQHLGFYFGKKPISIQASGFKIFYGLENPEYTQLLEQLGSDHSIKIIHLTREDKQAQFASLRRAKQLRAWTKGMGIERVDENLEEDSFGDFLKKAASASNLVEKELQNHQVLTVSYESLLNETNQTLFAIQEFLNVKPRKLFSILERQTQ